MSTSLTARSVGRTIAWAVAVTAVVVSSTLLHLGTRPGRDAAKEVATEVLEESIRGRVRIGEVARLSTSEVVLQDVLLADERGQPVARIAELRMSFRLLDLLAGRLVIPSLAVRGVWLSLSMSPEGDLALLRALEPTAPQPPDAEPMDVVIEDFRVSDVTLAGAGGWPAGLTVAIARARGSIRIDPDMHLELEELTASARREGDVVAHLRTTEPAVLSLEPGTRSHLGVAITGERDHVTLHAEAVAAETAPDDPPAVERIEVTLAIGRLTPHFASALGFDQLANNLTSPVEGWLRVHGRVRDLRFAGRLETTGGVVSLRGRLESMSRLDLDVRTPGLDVGRITSAVDELRVRGNVRLRTRLPRDDPELQPFMLQTEGLHVAGVELPALRLEAELGPDALRIEELDAPTLTEPPDARLDVSGRIGFGGDVVLDVVARLPEVPPLGPVEQAVGPVSGSVAADVHLDISIAEPEPRIDARVDVRIRRLRLGDLAIGSARVRGTAHGRLYAPAVDARVRLRRVSLPADLEVERVRVDVEGGPRRYRARAELRLPGERLVRTRITARTRAPEERWILEVDGTARGVLRTPIRLGSTPITFRPGESVSVERLVLRSGSQVVVLSGRYRFDGPSRVAATARNLLLGPVLELVGLGVRDAQGELDAEASFTGTTAQPRLQVRATLREARYGDLAVGHARLVARVDMPAREIEGELVASLAESTDLDATSGLDGMGELAARWSADLGRGGIPDAVMSPRTEHQARLRASRVPLEALAAVAPGLPRVEGRLEGHLEVAGTLEDVEGTARVDVRDLRFNGSEQVLHVRVEMDADPRGVEAMLRIADARAEIGSLAAQAGSPLPRLVARPEEALLERPWEVAVTVPGHRLDRLPSPLDDYVDFPARLSGTLHVLHDTRGLGATLAAVVDWDEQVVSGRTACEPGAVDRMELRGRLSSGRALVASAAFDGAAALELEAQSGAELLGAIRRDTLPPVHGSLRTTMPLGRLPHVCERVVGDLVAQYSFAGLFTRDPRLEGALVVEDLGVRGRPPVDVCLETRAAGEELEAALLLAGGPDSRLRASATVPLRFPQGEALPQWAGERPWRLEAHLERAPVSPVLDLVPNVARTGGHLDGRVEARGTADVFEARGAIAMRDVTLSIEDPPQRIESLRGNVRFTPERVAIEDVRGQDLDGVFGLDGVVTLDDGSPDAARLRLRADDFPLRREGVIAAYLSTDSWITADLQDRGRVDVDVRELLFRLPPELPHEVQGLDPHADMVFVDARPNGLRPERPEEESGPGEDATPPPPPVHIYVDATQPFWVRRVDFAVQLSADLEVIVEQRGGEQVVRLVGPVDVRRGYLEFFGKRFELEPGRIVFTGGSELNPTIALTAVHELSGGEEARVHIVGTLEEPELTFSSTVEGADTAGEVLALIARGRGGVADVEAGEQAASFLAGVTAGFVTMAARRRFGDIVPVIALETGERLGTGRLRVGFTADRLVPEFLDDIIIGAYVEGFVGTGAAAEQGGPARQATGGVALELLHPRDLATRGRFQPPGAWSVDLVWEP